MVVKWTNKQYTISETIGNDVNDSKCSISDQKFVKFIDFGSQLFETLKKPWIFNEHRFGRKKIIGFFT